VSSGPTAARLRSRALALVCLCVDAWELRGGAL
jgi:hypothetical protein